MFKKYPKCEHILLVGGQGKYKDVTAVKWCFEGFTEGRKIFSNLILGFDHELVKTYDDLLVIHGDNWFPSYLLFHDVGRVFNARDWNKKDVEQVIVDARRDCVNNLRKRGVSLIGTCHDEHEVDVDIRRILDWFVYCDFVNRGDPDNMEDDVVVLKWFSEPKEVINRKVKKKEVYENPQNYVRYYNTLEEANRLV